MSKKIIYRVLGIIASILIIMSVFFPYSSSESLWNIYEDLNSLYLPIMIIIFGLVGIIFFILNKKTEFIYMSSGALLFFVVIKTISSIKNNGFTDLGIGYYILIGSLILMTVMVFMCNLKVKTQNIELVENKTNKNIDEQPSLLEQVDKLYGEQAIDQMNQPVDEGLQPMETESQIVEPTLIQPINPVEEVQPTTEIIQDQSMVSIHQTLENEKPEITPEQPIIYQNPVISEFGESNKQNVNNVFTQPQPEVRQVNPVLQQFSTNNSQLVNNVPVQPQLEVRQVNPVLQQFSTSNSQLVNNIPVQPQLEVRQVNPVLQQFNSQQNSFAQNFSSNVSQPMNQMQSINPNPTVDANIQPNPVVQDFMNSNMSQNVTNNNQGTGGVDIFGQPLN